MLQTLLKPRVKTHSFSTQTSGNNPLSGQVLTLLRIIGKQKWSPFLEQNIAESQIAITQRLVEELLSKISEPKVALRFFLWARKVPGFVHTAESIRCISRLWSHTKHFYAFLDISDQFRRLNCPMTSTRFTVLIMGYGRAGMLDEAIDILERMKMYGCTPDLKHYNCVLDALTKADELEASQSLYTHMLHMGIVPNVVTYTIMISGLAKAEKFDAAFTQFCKVVEEGCEPDLQLYTALISSLCKAGQSDRALRVFEEMGEMGLRPDVSFYNVLIKTLCQQGKVSEAMNAYFSMVKAGHQPDSLVLATVVNTHFKGRKLENEAQSFGHKLQKVGLANASTHAAAIYYVCKSGKICCRRLNA